MLDDSQLASKNRHTLHITILPDRPEAITKISEVTHHLCQDVMYRDLLYKIFL